MLNKMPIKQYSHSNLRLQSCVNISKFITNTSHYLHSTLLLNRFTRFQPKLYTYTCTLREGISCCGCFSLVVKRSLPECNVKVKNKIHIILLVKTATLI